MSSKFVYYKADILLFSTFLIFIALIKYYYPAPALTWDGDSYIYYSQHLQPNIRPIGYSVFLWTLYTFSHSLSFVVYSQFLLYFFSILLLLKTVSKYRSLNHFQYYLLGFLLLIEPASLYNCNVILSDILFSSLTYYYLITLLLYINSRKRWLLIAHIITLVFCIGTRHIALFYPFFTIAVFIIYLKNIKLAFINILLLLFVSGSCYIGTIKLNNKIYGIPVYSPFSGWTEANDALYILPKIKTDIHNIHDPEIRALNTFFVSYLDTTSFKPNLMGLGYLWDQRSPLNVLRKHVDDSLATKNGHGDFTLTWYLLAPKYARYGSFIQRNFPYQYFLYFILPNTSTLIKPDNGEMLDYYTAKKDLSSSSLQRYGLTMDMLYCREQIYKEHINSIVSIYYQIRSVLFILAFFSLLVFKKQFDKRTFKMLLILSLFVLLFCLSTLYSTYIVIRFLLPVLSFFTITIFIAVANLVHKPAMEKDDDPGNKLP